MKKLLIVASVVLSLSCIVSSFEDGEPEEVDTSTIIQELSPRAYDYWVSMGLPIEEEFQKILEDEPVSSAPWKDFHFFERNCNRPRGLLIGYTRVDPTIRFGCGGKGDFKLLFFNAHLMRSAGLVFYYRTDLNLWISADCRVGAIVPGKRPRFLTAKDGYPTKYPSVLTGTIRCR